MLKCIVFTSEGEEKCKCSCIDVHVFTSEKKFIHKRIYIFYSHAKKNVRVLTSERKFVHTRKSVYACV